MGSVWCGPVPAENVCEGFAIKKAWSRSVLAYAENAKQLGTDGRWQHETLYKEELELLQHSTNLRFGGFLMRQAFDAGKSGDWANYMEVFLESGKLSVWTSAKVRECSNEVEQENEDQQSIVQEILL